MPKAKPSDALVPRSDLKDALLELLADGAEHRDDEIVPALGKRFGLTAAQMALTVDGGRTKFGKECDFAKSELTMECRVFRAAPKVYRLSRPDDPPRKAKKSKKAASDVGA